MRARHACAGKRSCNGSTCVARHSDRPPNPLDHLLRARQPDSCALVPGRSGGPSAPATEDDPESSVAAALGSLNLAIGVEVFP